MADERAEAGGGLNSRTIYGDEAAIGGQGQRGEID